MVSKNTKETKELGRKVADNVINRHPERAERVEGSHDYKIVLNSNRAVVLALTGELGCGKTTFV